jgi:hypothetical protein
MSFDRIRQARVRRIRRGCILFAIGIALLFSVPTMPDRQWGSYGFSFPLFLGTTGKVVLGPEDHRNLNGYAFLGQIQVQVYYGQPVTSLFGSPWVVNDYVSITATPDKRSGWPPPGQPLPTAIDELREQIGTIVEAYQPQLRAQELIVQSKSRRLILWRQIARHLFLCAGVAAIAASLWPLCFRSRAERGYERIRRGRCPTCGYQVSPDHPICPECGYGFSEDDVLVLRNLGYFGEL